VPALLVIAIGVVSAVVLSQNANAGSNPLQVKVFAQQFAWRFEYPEQESLKSYELVLPVDRGIEFEMTASDVIHSFWIPEMGQKQDVLPGVETQIVVTPTREGHYTLVCTELCGLGHAFTPAGTNAAAGPNLDDVSAAAEQAGVPVDEFVRQSITDPDAVVTEGYAAGVMPKTFGDSLSDEEIDALVAYLTGSAS
jgi:cytochrome c oxidase subunit 2